MSLSSTFEVSFQYVGRSTKCMADALAKQGLRYIDFSAPILQFFFLVHGIMLFIPVHSQFVVWMEQLFHL